MEQDRRLHVDPGASKYGGIFALHSFLVVSRPNFTLGRTISAGIDTRHAQPPERRYVRCRSRVRHAKAAGAPRTCTRNPAEGARHGRKYRPGYARGLFRAMPAFSVEDRGAGYARRYPAGFFVRLACAAGFSRGLHARRDVASCDSPTAAPRSASRWQPVQVTGDRVTGDGAAPASRSVPR